MRAFAILFVAVAVSGLVASTAVAGDPKPVGATGSQNVAVQWTAYAEPEPEHLGADPTAARLLSQTFSDRAALTGLTWTTGLPDAVWLQTRIDGEWTSWEPLEVDTEHGSDDDDVQRGGTQPAVLNEPEAFRYLVEGPIDGAEVFIFAPLPPSLSDVDERRPPEPIQPEDFEPIWQGAKFVRDRAEWDSTNCRLPDEEFNYSASRAVVVHHTAGTNNYSQSQVPGILSGICAYQTSARGLGDFGYNFAVDRFGTVWEGRTGSKRAPIMSAHARGFNYVTQGVVLLGDFTSVHPSDAQVSGLQSILNWLTGWHGIDPDADVTLVAGSDGSGFSEGDIRVVKGVTGHREVGQTSCPGSTFFPSLTSIASNTNPTDFGNNPLQPLCRGRSLTYIGSPGDDIIDGTQYDDVIMALEGDDTVYGLSGTDLICGGPGDDRVFGGSGADRLFGDNGSDTLNGGSGDDVLNGQNGPDTLLGRTGNDRATGGDGNDRVVGGSGADALFGSAGSDVVKAGAGQDVVRGGSGSDTLYGGREGDALYGQNGADTVRAGDGNDRVKGGKKGDRLFGENGRDTISGSGGDDVVRAGTGNDWVLGGSDRDELYGDRGDDLVEGNQNDDRLFGGVGTDTLDGGGGNDECTDLSPLTTYLSCEAET